MLKRKTILSLITLTATLIAGQVYAAPADTKASPEAILAGVNTPQSVQNAHAPMIRQYPKNIDTPPKLLSTTPRWAAKSGDTLKTVLTRWSAQAGWQLKWQIENTDYTISNTFNYYDGSFEEAIEELALTYKKANLPINFHLWKGNKVVEITG